jgi:hypothetical protein
MRQSFSSIPLVPSIGNNDVYPHDSLAAGPNPVRIPPAAPNVAVLALAFRVMLTGETVLLPTQILANLTANWMQWLSPISQQTMSQGGYFASQVAPGLQSTFSLS